MCSKTFSCVWTSFSLAVFTECCFPGPELLRGINLFNLHSKPQGRYSGGLMVEERTVLLNKAVKLTHGYMSRPQQGCVICGIQAPL